MKRKGFTLVELLVVIAIIALLMSILMPALNRVRATANRVACSSNLSNIGKSLMMYANDYREEYPRFGGSRSVWGETGGLQDWKADTEQLSYGETPTDIPVSASLYMLVRLFDVNPKIFVCKGDSGTKEFKLADYTDTSVTREVTYADCWDFGWKPGTHVSYSYQMPYKVTTSKNGHQVYVTSNPELPLASDRSPFYDTNADALSPPPNSGAIDAQDTKGPTAKEDTVSGLTYVDERGIWNSASHNREGQNVLYNDSHVDWEKYPAVGIQQDNIFLYWAEGQTITLKSRMIETAPPENAVGKAGSAFLEDSFLVSERQNKFGSGTKITGGP